MSALIVCVHTPVFHPILLKERFKSTILSIHPYANKKYEYARLCYFSNARYSCIITLHTHVGKTRVSLSTVVTNVALPNLEAELWNLRLFCSTYWSRESFPESRFPKWRKSRLLLHFTVTWCIAGITWLRDVYHGYCMRVGNVRLYNRDYVAAMI